MIIGSIRLAHGRHGSRKNQNVPKRSDHSMPGGGDSYTDM